MIFTCNYKIDIFIRLKRLALSFLKSMYKLIYEEEIRMSKESLQAQLEQIQKAIDASKVQIQQALDNHNKLIGFFEGTQAAIKIAFEESEKVADDVVEKVGEIVD